MTRRKTRTELKRERERKTGRRTERKTERSQDWVRRKKRTAFRLVAVEGVTCTYSRLVWWSLCRRVYRQMFMLTHRKRTRRRGTETEGKALQLSLSLPLQSEAGPSTYPAGLRLIACTCWTGLQIRNFSMYMHMCMPANVCTYVCLAPMRTHVYSRRYRDT